MSGDITPGEWRETTQGIIIDSDNDETLVAEQINDQLRIEMDGGYMYFEKRQV
jgi:hypothetical protein